MLTDQEFRLLTAAVDGELTPSEQRRLEHLLARSETARNCYAQLLEQSQRLRQLAQVHPPIDLSKRILHVIQARALTPTPLPPVRRPQVGGAVPVWLPVALAASILLAIMLGSYLVFSHQRMQRTEWVQQQRNPSSPASPSRSTDRQDLPPKSSPTDEVVRNTEADDNDGVHPDRPTVQELLPRPQVVDSGPILTAPSLPESQPFQVVTIELMSLFSFSEIQRPDVQRKVREHWKKATPLRVELFARDPIAAADHLQKHLKAMNQNVLVDAFAQDRLKRKASTPFLFYSETISPDEFWLLLSKFAHTQTANHDPAKLDDKFVLSPFQPSDFVDLAQMLGIDVSSLRSGRVMGPLSGLDHRQSLETQTGLHLAQTLSGWTPSANAASARQTIVVTYPPPRGLHVHSKEIQSFVRNRNDAKREWPPILIVLRWISG